MKKLKGEIYLVPYAHLDTQWRWEYPTTIKVYLKRTLEENFTLLEKYPEYCFNFTGALRYAMIKEYYPDQFDRLKEYIREGRWHIAGTCLDETDALIPSSESMVRNILYGDRWAKKELGKSSRDYMIPDCFGFPANMPTVMAHCGINGFSSQKLTWNSAVGIPFEIGMWQGPDGEEVVSAFNPCKYDSHLKLPIHLNPTRLKRLKKLGEATGVWKSFQYYGVGDIGGSPTEGSVKRAIRSIRHKSKNRVVRQGAADCFFDELTDDEKAKLERYQGDLLLTNHSAGTLTSAAIMKRWNRKNEQLAFAAEGAAVCASWAAGTAYPFDKITTAWSRVIGGQMHDILPGTSTPTAYEFSQNDEVVALNTWTSVLSDAAESVAPLLKGDGELILFNPYEESRTDLVDIELPLATDHVSLVAPDGRSYACQVRKGDSGDTVVTCSPELPPLGWTRFSIRDKPLPVESGAHITTMDDTFLMENSLYKVKVMNDGCIVSIVHKGLKRELLKKPLAYELQKERPMQFPAWNMDWKDRRKPPFCRIESGGSTTVVENGPLRCTLRISYTYQSSELVKEISLGADSEIVEFTERINWRETGCSLKLAMTSTVSQPDVTCNWETARVQRGVNNKKLFEMPSRLWVDVSEGDSWGISLLEDSKYGYDRPKTDTLRLTLLYTPEIWYIPITGCLDQKSQDWGRHTIRYALYAHKGDWRGTDTLARRFNQPVRSFRISGEVKPGSLDHLSLLRISTPQIGIMAVKVAENGEGIIVRLYERYDRELSGHLEFPSRLLEAREVNGLEESVGDAMTENNKLIVSLPASGMRAYRVTLSDRNPGTVMKQNRLSLPMNEKLISANGEKGGGIFPAELVPEIIEAGAIQYHLAGGEEKDALSCCGQTIDITRDHSHLFVLAGAVEDCAASITWLDEAGQELGRSKLDVPAMTGFIGQWDKRIWKKEPRHHLKYRRDYAWINRCIGVEPGYVKRQRLEWYSTHIHADGFDNAYQYGYMFTFVFDIPEQAIKILLPKEPQIKIFAMTTSDHAVKAKSTIVLKDEFDF